MAWTCSFIVDGTQFAAIRRKADKFGVSVSRVLRMAVIEYLENNPKGNEDEEIKKYAMWRKGGDATP